LSNHDYIFVRNNLEAGRFVSNNSFGINCTPSGIGVTFNGYGGASTNSNLVLEGNNGDNFISILSSATSGLASSIFAKDGIRFALATAKDGTGFSEKMRVAPTTGNILIGTTTDGGQKLQVTGTALISSSLTASGGVNIGSNALGSDRMFQISGTAFTTGTTQFASVINPTFGNTITDLYGIYLSLASGTSVTNRYFLYIDTEGPGSVPTNDFSLYVNNVSKSYFKGKLGIGTTSPAASSLLDVTSTTEGFLPPRMTTTQKNAIGTPAAGLIVYDTTLNKLCVRTAAAWETITSI
jgi:hypothetical protein